MRLIDADALADALFGTRKNYPQWVADTIGNMPEAVVRCKDCKHWCKALIQCSKFTVNGVAHCTSPDWFCADGEQKSAQD